MKQKSERLCRACETWCNIVIEQYLLIMMGRLSNIAFRGIIATVGKNDLC